MSKKGRRRSKRQYFTQEHEDAIVEYNNTSDSRRRTQLYVAYIQPAFDEMVDKIVYTYKFTSLPNIENLRDECKIYLTTILDKYDRDRGSKAFSYFSVITKNWFIHKVKKTNLQNKREINIDELNVEHQIKYFSTKNKYEEQRQEAEFWKHLWEEIESWEKMKLKTNEEKVLKAIKILLNDVDNSNLIFNKKAIYLYIREITGLNTKQVVNNLNKLRIKYRAFKQKWDGGRF